MSMSKTVIATTTKTKAATTTTTTTTGPSVAASKPAAITTPRASTANVNVPKQSMVSASTSSAKLNSVDSIGNGTAESIVDAEKKIVNEFVYLLDKSKQLFNGLKDLPQCGQRNSQWQAYFGRTFDTYTKLWKFQQQNRHVLDSKYGLKRWQIGEIASKIGQLYYHYYLRTSESNYLNEAYSFYQAIQTRAYYSKVNKDEKPDLMVKKLRYLARFIVVSLLLKKDRQVHELIDELGRQIDDYVKIYDPEDQLEWQLVKNEINDFIEADTVLTIDGGATATATSPLLSIRLNASEVPQIGANPQFAHMFAHNAANAHVNPLLTSPSSSSNGGGSGSGGSHHFNEHLSLQEILIVGNCNDQIKFSELSLDMYRMLQACEREPTLGSNGQNDLNEKSNNGTAAIADPTKSGNKETATKPATGNNEETVNSSESGQRENPHKFLLYKPTFSQLYTYLSSAFKELPPHTVLMLYVSADGLESGSRAVLSSSHHHHLNHHSNNDSTAVSSSSYDMGGVRTNTKRDSMASCQLAPSMNGLSLVGGGGHNSDSLHRRSSSYHFKDTHCIYPGDLYAFTRKPIFLIIDSLNSNAFRNFPNLFGQPFLSFMSPVILPSVFLERQNQNGSIFTLFLVNPLQAFCYICNIIDINSETFQKAKIQLKVIFIEIARAIHKSKQLDHVILQYCHDDFMRSFILRFVFCYCSLRLHRAFKGPDYYPSSQPTFSSDVIESRHIHKLVIDLSLILNSRQMYLDVTADDL